MSDSRNLDRESFETSLANALAIQKSGLDITSLSAVIEIQQFIATGEFDLDRAMQRIADRALELFDASGVAIGLLEADELVYRAGAGTACNDIGRHVAAVLNVPSSHSVRQEILRVENAETDARIEAQICRQFGAMSLVMLPICNNHVLVGVLHVVFDQAHSFSDPEIRLYRVIVGVLEDALFRRLQPAKKQEMMSSGEQAFHQVDSQRNLQSTQETANASKIPADAFEQNSEQNSLRAQSRKNKYANSATSPLRPRLVYWPALIRRLIVLWTKVTMATGSTVNRRWNGNFWRIGACLSAAVTLGTIAWLYNAGHLSNPRKSSVSTRVDTEQPAPARALFVNDEPNPLSSRSEESMRPSSGFRRVQVGPNETDYISEDVTIRNFTSRSAKPRIQKGVKEVNVGDDVTVRYFINSVEVSPLPKTSETGTTTNH